MYISLMFALFVKIDKQSEIGEASKQKGKKACDLQIVVKVCPITGNTRTKVKPKQRGTYEENGAKNGYLFGFGKLQVATWNSWLSC